VGLDLSIRGDVSLSISRGLGDSDVVASASVVDNAGGYLIAPMLELTPDQVFRVNSVALAHQFYDLPTVVSGVVRAVEPPGAYTIEFDDNGRVSQMLVTAVSEVRIAAPAAGATVSKAGFTVTWTPSYDADVLIEISVSGEKVDLDSSTGTSPSCAYFQALPDNGSSSVNANALADLLPGTFDVTIRRYREVPQTLGFAEGLITVETSHHIAILLTD
ncbi:MAG: hypothetical protein KJ749_11335, partial [Planctomycetes bacterium]|nr:hypothetical protein [Planctomycetota bacterium]